MFELIFITSVLGLGLAIDYVTSNDDEMAPAVETSLAQDALRFDGGEARDHVTGNALDNLIFGKGENDLLSGMAGDDTLVGAGGDDRLFGGTGDDVAHGGAGDDRIFLGDGDDTTLTPDMALQDAGDDFIRGGAGADQISDTSGSNQIYGDLHADEIITVDGLTAEGTIDPSAPKGADTVDGGYGNDTILADGADVLTGGPGEDVFAIAVPSNEIDAPAVVTDFDLRNDLFSVVYLGEAPADDTVTFAFDSAANMLRAQIDGQEVAVLQGMRPADIPFINTFVTTLPDLMADAA